MLNSGLRSFQLLALTGFPLRSSEYFVLAFACVFDGDINKLGTPKIRRSVLRQTPRDISARGINAC